MAASLVPLYKRKGYTETFNRCWQLIDMTSGHGRYGMYAEIRIYKRKNRYSYECGFRCGPPGYYGFGTGCRGGSDVYPSARDATAATIECIRANLGRDEYRDDILALLPVADPQLSLFGE